MKAMIVKPGNLLVREGQWVGCAEWVFYFKGPVRQVEVDPKTGNLHKVAGWSFDELTDCLKHPAEYVDVPTDELE